MTLEEKNLLLQDLCARLPYGVIISVHDTFPCTILPYFNMRLNPFVSILSSTEPIFKTEDKLIKRILKEHEEYLEFRPYLRPMPSMSDEEKKEFESLGWRVDELDGNVPWNHNTYNVFDGVDWLNKHHFDYRGLIEKGLALEATEGMYN